MFVPRPYQVTSIEKIKEFLSGPDKSTILVAPTGAGKSWIIAETAIAINAPLIVIQPSSRILKQNYDKYTSYGFKAEIFSASAGIKEIGRVTFVTIGSVISFADEFKKIGVKHVIVDESDVAPKSSNQIGTFCKAIGAKKIIGLTATPITLLSRMSGTFLEMLNQTRGSIYKNICHIIQCQEMTSGGWWTPIDYRPINVNTSMLDLNITGNDFTSESLIKFLQENNISKHIYYYCKRLAKAKHILIFVDSIDYADELASHIEGAVSIHSKLSASERAEREEGFFSGKYRVAINVGVMAVGVDFPQLQVIIHARPLNSIRLWYQMIGRLVRLHPGKNIGFVIDLSGNFRKFGRIEDLVFAFDERFGHYLRNKSRILTTNSRIEAWRNERSKSSPYARFKMPFGKYRGRELVWIYQEDRRYLEWVAFGEFTPTRKEHLIVKETLMKYMR